MCTVECKECGRNWCGSDVDEALDRIVMDGGTVASSLRSRFKVVCVTCPNGCDHFLLRVENS